jgi:hypothetical protein
MSILPSLSIFGALTLAGLVVSSAACGTGTVVPAGGTTSGGTSGGTTPGGSASACEDFGGTCVKGSTSNTSPTCTSPMIRVVEGDGCPGSFDVCCVAPRKAGTREVSGSNGLLCTDKAFADFTGGTCDNGKGNKVSCGVGCACGASAGGPACDCGRGLPGTKKGQVECAVFDCGAIMCGLGCRCESAATSTCRCP